MSDVQTTKLKVDFVNPRSGDRPASIKADGKYWSISDEDVAKVKEGETYHFAYKAKAGTGKWTGRTFLDITGIIASDTTDSRPNAAAPHANGNGHAAPNKDARITKLALSKLVAPIPFNPSAEVMADQMTAILQAAEITFQRMFGDDIPF